MARFYKEKMMARLAAEGRLDEVTPEMEAIMDNLDGCEAIEQCWNRMVLGEPVLYCTGKDGTKHYVYEGDCIY